jgi:Ser/Thr protein kinase RdoA (MazF antagonist)
MQQPDTQQRPYEGLDPGVVIAAVESLGLLCDGRLLALNSFENRVYRIGQETGPALVAKFYRPGRWTDAAIVEEHEFSAELAHSGLSVVAPLTIDSRTLHEHAGFRFAVFPLQGGRAPELGVRENLRHLGQCLGRLHAIGARKPFADRPTLSLAEQGDAAVDCILDGEWLPPELEENFAVLADALLDAAEQRWALAEPVANLRLHGDCHPGNLLWRDDRAHFVDLDDCCNGPAMQDLWMLLSGTPAEQQQQLEWLLEGYRVFAEFDPMQRHLIEPLRTLRLLHYHAWIARRWHDPAFPAAFPWFGDPRHWEEVIGQMQEQLSALQEGD